MARCSKISNQKWSKSSS